MCYNYTYKLTKTQIANFCVVVTKFTCFVNELNITNNIVNYARINIMTT